jgi:hypothetical protein
MICNKRNPCADGELRDGGKVAQAQRLIVAVAQTSRMPIGVFFAIDEAGDDRSGCAGIEFS